MDISFVTREGKFNYRVCGIFLQDYKVLAMKDERSPYYYLPGGRVAMHETAEDAILREVREELGIQVRIQRPLWLNQSFFREDVDQLRYHELCLYFLIDYSQTNLLSKGEEFTLREGEKSHRFCWLDFNTLEEEYFYPLFLKKEIFHLPLSFSIRTEVE